jgi:hypothetical protein
MKFLLIWKQRIGVGLEQTWWGHFLKSRSHDDVCVGTNTSVHALELASGGQSTGRLDSRQCKILPSDSLSLRCRCNEYCSARSNKKRNSFHDLLVCVEHAHYFRFRSAYHKHRRIIRSRKRIPLLCTIACASPLTTGICM